MTINDMPREQIPWYPAIDRHKCIGCRTCVEFCPHGTYAFDEAAGEARVAYPFNCIVGCTSCEAQCPAGAISFPPLAALAELINGKSDRSGGCGCDSCGL
jgi:NAD-dependent dihydropyrimidine dehydrogenase PreA subunit